MGFGIFVFNLKCLCVFVWCTYVQHAHELVVPVPIYAYIGQSRTSGVSSPILHVPYCFGVGSLTEAETYWFSQVV